MGGMPRPIRFVSIAPSVEGTWIKEMPIRGRYIIPRMSLVRWRKAGAELKRWSTFKGARRGRDVKSEVHFLSMLDAKQRRARFRHQIRERFYLRLRGRYLGPFLFNRTSHKGL